MTTDSPLPTTIGCSWGWTPADPSTLDPYFERMAAQGQTFFVASGDSSTWPAQQLIAWPADDANVVSVGGTDLVTAKARRGHGSRRRRGWTRGGRECRRTRIAIPSWQQLSGVINSSNKGIVDAAQRAGRVGEREFYVLHLRRPDGVPGERVWRHQLCGADVGRLPGSGESTAGLGRQRTGGVHQPDDLRAERDVELYDRLPRHYERHVWLPESHGDHICTLRRYR
jgi:hypothetical protein